MAVLPQIEALARIVPLVTIDSKTCLCNGHQQAGSVVLVVARSANIHHDVPFLSKVEWDQQKIIST